MAAAAAAAASLGSLFKLGLLLIRSLQIVVLSTLLFMLMLIGIKFPIFKKRFIIADNNCENTSDDSILK